MENNFFRFLVLTFGFYLTSFPAHAYIAPLIGAAGVIATVVVLAFTTLLSFFCIFYNQIKRLFGFGKKKSSIENSEVADKQDVNNKDASSS